MQGWAWMIDGGWRGPVGGEHGRAWNVDGRVGAVRGERKGRHGRAWKMDGRGQMMGR